MRIRKVIYDREKLTPLLHLYIEDAPHRRQDGETIGRYRRALRAAFLRADILPPIAEPIDLVVWFINPTSPDNDNLLCALYRALDRYIQKGRNIGLMVDDSLIQCVFIRKMYVNAREPASSWRPQPLLPSRAISVNGLVAQLD